MAVEDAEAPRRQHEQTGAGKQDPDERDGQIALVAAEARRDCGNQQRGRDDSGEDDCGDDRRQQRGDGAGDPIGVAALSARDERCVYRNE